MRVTLAALLPLLGITVLEADVLIWSLILAREPRETDRACEKITACALFALLGCLPCSLRMASACGGHVGSC